MTPTPEAVREAIRAAPAFARIGLSVRDPRLRARAEEALSVAVAERLARPEMEVERDQLSLPL